MPKIQKTPPRGFTEWGPGHVYSSGTGVLARHDGYVKDCRRPECIALMDERRARVEEPPDPLEPCPVTGGRHRWVWGDDGNGHSGDVCRCGAYEE